MLSAEGFRFLFLPVQLTQFPMARWKTRTGLWTLDWTGFFFGGGGGNFFEGGGGCIIFSSLKKITFQPFPNRLYFFLWLRVWERGVVLYMLLYSSLLLVGFVLCLSFLVWVGGLDWSLCLTQGRHVSLES